MAENPKVNLALVNDIPDGSLEQGTIYMSPDVSGNFIKVAVTDSSTVTIFDGSSYATKQYVIDNEYVVATALNDLNSRVDNIDEHLMEKMKGGTAGQLLVKDSSTDYDMSWRTVSIGSQIVYDSSNKTISLKDAGGNVLGTPVDATDFIKDGMVNDVSIHGSNMVISFNTDAGKEDISIPLSHIFDSSNYYTKSESDTKYVWDSSSPWEPGAGTGSAQLKGSGADASGDYSVAQGLDTTASGSNSHAEGVSTVAFGVGSHAEGDGAKASGNCSHAEGDATDASGNCSHAEGVSTVAFGVGSHAEGFDTSATGNYSHAEGYKTDASGNYSHAEGSNTKAYGDYSHAEGSKTNAYGNYSHAEGYHVTASGSYSHAEGADTSAIGAYSHAEGNYTNARGQYSHAEGNYTNARGQYSHAEGSNTNAYGIFSHAEGNGTEATGQCSHAEGAYTSAIGQYSHTEGYVTRTTNDYEHAQGMFNISRDNTLFSIGNGNNDGDSPVHSNALEIMKNGDAYLYGVASFDGQIIGSQRTLQFFLDVNPISDPEYDTIFGDEVPIDFDTITRLHLYIDDYPSDKISDMMEEVGAENIEEFYDIVYDANVNGNSQYAGNAVYANEYVYEDTIEIDGTTYYLWYDSDDEMYAIMRTNMSMNYLDSITKYNNSNSYVSPFVAIVTEDLEVRYDDTTSSNVNANYQLACYKIDGE